MPYSVFDEVPEAGYSYTDELPVAILLDGGPHEEVRRKLAAVARRRYQWRLRRDDCAGFERTEVDDFLVRLRSLQFEAFFIKDPFDFAASGVSLGTGDGSATTFSIPSTAPELRHYPIDNAALVVTVAGSPATVASVDTEGRTITLASPPGVGAAVVAAYEYYRLVRLEGDLSWAHLGGATFEGTVALVEVEG